MSREEEKKESSSLELWDSDNSFFSHLPSGWWSSHVLYIAGSPKCLHPLLLCTAFPQASEYKCKAVLNTETRPPFPMEIGFPPKSSRARVWFTLNNQRNRTCSVITVKTGNTANALVTETFHVGGYKKIWEFKNYGLNFYI